uniref:CUB domain-containing protein n=1 Tax=Ditylenchus dipsaci TaxID=166011 RepID=A0A915D8T5_9BILA
MSFALPLDRYVNVSVFREFYLKHREPTSSLDCVWHVQVPKWLQVAIFVEEFELASPNQCHENFLEIYAGQILPVPLKRFCGSATHVYTGQSIVFLRLFAIGAAQVLASHVRILFSTYVPLKNCSERSLFACGDDVCIPHALVCNGNSNCLYRKDEDHCEQEKNIVRWIVSGYYFELVVVIFIISLVVLGLCVWYKPCKGNQELIDNYLKQLSGPPAPHNLEDFTGRTTNDDTMATLAGLQTNSLFNEIASETSSPSLAEKKLWEDGDIDGPAPHHSHCKMYKPPISITANGSCLPDRSANAFSSCTVFSSMDIEEAESAWNQRQTANSHNKTVRIVHVPEEESKAMQKLDECLRSEASIIQLQYLNRGKRRKQRGQEEEKTMKLLLPPKFFLCSMSATSK